MKTRSRKGALAACGLLALLSAAVEAGCLAPIARREGTRVSACSTRHDLESARSTPPGGGAARAVFS
jgi:hypothetical protein